MLDKELCFILFDLTHLEKPLIANFIESGL